MILHPEDIRALTADEAIAEFEALRAALAARDPDAPAAGTRPAAHGNPNRPPDARAQERGPGKPGRDPCIKCGDVAPVFEEAPCS